MADPDEPIEAVVAAVEAGTDAIAVPEDLLKETAAETPAAEGTALPEVPRSMYAQILGMGVPEKIKLALRGNKDARMILIQDSNKVVRRLVLQNPRISDPEIVAAARSKNSDEETLRIIGDKREWARLYAVRSALATNPKTPITVAIRLLATLTERDLGQLAKSRNIPSAVQAQARRMIAAKSERGGGGGGH